MQLMTIDPEEIVQLALDAHKNSYGEKGVNLMQFELELRRLLMQKNYKSTNTYTYTVCPPNVMGTWENKKQLLQG